MSAQLKFDKNFWLRFALFATAAIIIMYFVPGQSHKKYSYEVGKPWTQPALYAPAQLVVGYDAATEKTIKDSIARTIVPYFTHDTKVEAEVLKQLNQTSPLFRQQARMAVERVYHDGIVSNAVYDSIQSGKLPSIRILSGNDAKKIIPTEKMRSAKLAYEFIDQLTQIALSQSNVDFSQLLKPNFVEDRKRTKEAFDNQCAIALSRTPIDKGELIIARGEKVTAQTALAIEACQKVLNSDIDGEARYPLLGYAVAIIALLTLLFVYFYIYRRQSILENRSRLIFALFMLTAVTITTYSLMHRVAYGPLLMPITLIPIVMVTFFDTRTAFFVSVIQVLLCSLIENGEGQINFILLHLVACAVAIDTLQELTKRSQLIRTAICVFFAYAIMYAAMRIIENGNLKGFDTHVLVYFALNAIMLSFAYVIIFVFERIFGFVSRVTLVELSDINTPLLQELSEKCPGTFQHSVQLSNLVAEAAREIGANSQLARAGALYHDIGKMDNPAFFTENQHDVNPHELLTPEQSAKIVIRHVTDGLKRAEKEKLPAEIKDFILQHHGKNLAKYFYTTACNANGGEPVDPAPYTYPGPNPRTKETSLLMMADATEAASRSLKEYNDETISNLVNKIIDGQIAQGLMKDSPLSFRDVEIVKRVFISRLRTMYHTRISYPELKKPTGGA